MTERVTRRWFLRAASVSGGGLAAVLPFFKSARAAPLPEPEHVPPELYGHDGDVPFKPLEPGSNLRGVRRYPLGLGTTLVAPGATALVAARPQLPFRPTRIVSPSTGLELRDLRVGCESLLVAAAAVPVEVFAVDAIPIHFDAPVAVPGVDVILVVENTTAVPRLFSGVVIGDVAQ